LLGELERRLKKQGAYTMELDDITRILPLMAAHGGYLTADRVLRAQENRARTILRVLESQGIPQDKREKAIAELVQHENRILGLDSALDELGPEEDREGGGDAEA